MPKLKKPRVQRADKRTLAFTRLCEYYRHRTRDENAPHDLEMALQGQPQVTNGLKEAVGGLDAVLNALRAFDNHDAQAFMAFHDGLLKTDRQYLTLEEIAVAADLGSSRLLGLSVEALRAYGQSVSQVILWAAMPSLVKQSVKRAHAPLGGNDVDRLFKAASFVPTPKGPSFALQVNNQLPAPKDENVRPWDPQAQLEAIQSSWGASKAALPPAPEHESLSPTLESLHDRTTDLLDAE